MNTFSKNLPMRLEDKFGCVYRLINKINGNTYIGQTILKEKHSKRPEVRAKIKEAIIRRQQNAA